jgi:hypothetical protein
MKRSELALKAINDAYAVWDEAFAAGQAHEKANRVRSVSSHTMQQEPAKEYHGVFPRNQARACHVCWKDEKTGSRTRYVCTGMCLLSKSVSANGADFIATPWGIFDNRSKTFKGT